MANKKSIIRANRAGVFYGEVVKTENAPSGVIATIKDCRRIWYWDGAASISQLALEGTTRPSECKFTVTIPEMTVMDVIEIIPCTDAACASIDAVKVWKR